MKKRVCSAVLALVMIFSVCSVSAWAASNESVLKFDKNGEFKIMHLTDCQDKYPANDTMLKFIDATLKEYQPDIVVLGGDNVVADYKDLDAAIKQLVTIFVKNETCFTLVFGNHDHEHGMTNDELLRLYQKHGGKYCLAYDAKPALHGCATHNLPIYDSNMSKIKFNLWMFDSGAYVYDESGKKSLGYDCVTTDQIEWYEETSKALEKTAGGKVPSLAFQHIIVGDVYDALFYESPIAMGELTRSFNGKIYSFLPKTENIEEGFISEFPCPGYYNHGQFDSMVNRGDVLGIFSGHDHINTFVTELDGIKIVNTGGATYHSYGNEVTRGMRRITLNEDDLWDFDTETVTVNKFAIKNRDFAADAGINRVTATLITAGGYLLLFFGKLAALSSLLIQYYLSA